MWLVGSGEGEGGSYADDEEDARKQAARDGVEDCEEGPGHRADEGEAHEEVRDALLHDFFGDDVWVAQLRLVARLVKGGEFGQAGGVDGEAVGVDRCLRHEAVWEGQTQDAGDEGGAAEQKEVPVEASRLFERKLASLGCDAADVVVVVKQQHGQ